VYAVTSDAVTLVVVTHQGWLAADLTAAATRAGVSSHHSYGLDLPDLPGPLAWWAVTDWAARAHLLGVALDLQAPGPGFLNDVGTRLAGRHVWTGLVADLAAAPLAGWCKPAEMKVESLPASWWPDVSDFAAACRSAGLGPDSVVQVCPVRLDLDQEFRAFVIDGRVVATSPYLIDGATWGPGMVSTHTASAGAFAQDVADAVAGPAAGYVLDVGRTSDRSWVAVEANPAWSSSPYGADMDAVLATVLAANAPSLTRAWVPDPYLLARAARRRPLVWSRPPRRE